MNRISPMEIDRGLKVNWATFNVPTIIAVLTIGWYASAKQERQDARIDAIEQARASAIVTYDKRITAIEAKVSTLDNITYRVTVAEQGILNVNARADRIVDSMQGLRSDIAALSTKFEVLSQQIRTALPDQKP